MNSNVNYKIVKLNIMLLSDDCTLSNKELYINDYSNNHVIKFDDNSSNYFFYKNGYKARKPFWVKEVEEKVLTNSIGKYFSLNKHLKFNF